MTTERALASTLSAAMLVTATMLMSGGANAQTYRGLCLNTPYAGTPECAALKAADSALKAATRRIPGLTGGPRASAGRCTKGFNLVHDESATPECIAYRAARADYQQAILAVQAMKAGPGAAPAVPADTTLPVIRVSAPDRADESQGSIRLTGLVGDETSPPRLKVNGEPAPLFRPSADDDRIAAHTMAFDVEVPVGRPGDQRIILEVCDAARNCVAERATVTVIASATSGPEPVSRQAAATMTGESLEAYVARECVGQIASEGVQCEILAKGQWQAARRNEQAPAAQPSVAGDTTLPVIRVSAPDRADESQDSIRLTGLVGDETSPPRLKVNGEPAPLFRPSADDDRIAAHTMAFDVEVPVGRPGDQRIILEVCDAARNCVAERATVTVIASAAPAPPPAPAEPQVDMEALIAKLKEQQLLAAPKDTELPRIRIEAPAEVEVADTSARITGLVGDDGSPPRLKVNGNPVPLFQAPAGSAGFATNTLAFDIGIDTEATGDKAYVIEVCDAADNCIAERVAVSVVQADRPSIRGKNYALIIGNDTYEALPDLKTPVNDAKAVAEVLKARYAFDDENMTLLLNAKRTAILDQFVRLRGTLTSDDRLMIYYAGHGQIDPVTDEGFWQPVDARPEADYTWINNGDIKRYLRGMPARHVLIVADSCFSGSLTRGTAPEIKRDNDRFFTEIDSRFSRKVITSGGTEPVADSGSGDHSIFAYYFLKALARNKAPYVTSAELFTGFVRAVTNNSDQKPEYGTITGAGDEGAGDFTFIRRE